MKKPISKDFDTAILWLEVNEGGDGEAEACKRVAAWLNHKQVESFLRETARKAGIPVAKVRRRMKAANL